MLGTTPLISHVPAKAPISNKIKIAGVVVEILLPTPSKISVHLMLFLTPIKAPMAAANKSANWLAPSNDALPYNVTFIVNRMIRQMIGVRALKSDECFM